MGIAIQGQSTTSRGSRSRSLLLSLGCLGALFIIVGMFILRLPSQSVRSSNNMPSKQESSNVVNTSSTGDSSPQVQVEVQQPVVPHSYQSQSTLKANVSISSNDDQTSAQITVNDTSIDLVGGGNLSASTIKRESEGSGSTSNLSVKISNNATGEASQDTRTHSSIDISSSSDNGQTTIKSRERIR